MVLPQNICNWKNSILFVKLSLPWEKEHLLEYMFNIHNRYHFTGLKVWAPEQ